MQTVEHKFKQFMKDFNRYENLILDSTMSKSAKKCLRLYFYQYVLGRRPRSSKMQVIFDFGSLYHKFREELEISWKEKEDFDYCYGKAIAHVITGKLAPPDDQFKKWEFLTIDRLIKTCNVAFEYWKNEKTAGAIKVIDTEQPFNIQLPDGSWTGGRIDQVIEWNGKLWVRDFKTTTKEVQYFSRGLDPNDQATRYVYSLSKLADKPVQGVIFEVIYNAKTVGPKITPVMVSKTPSQLKKWEEEQMFFNRILAMCREFDSWPMSDSDCSFCDFAPVCRTPNEFAQMARLKQDYILQPWDHANVDQKEKIEL